MRVPIEVIFGLIKRRGTIKKTNVAGNFGFEKRVNLFIKSLWFCVAQTFNCRKTSFQNPQNAFLTKNLSKKRAFIDKSTQKT